MGILRELKLHKIDWQHPYIAYRAFGSVLTYLYNKNKELVGFVDTDGLMRQMTLDKIIKDSIEFWLAHPELSLKDVGCSVEVIETPHGVIELTKVDKIIFKKQG